MGMLSISARARLSIVGTKKKAVTPWAFRNSAINRPPVIFAKVRPLGIVVSRAYGCCNEGLPATKLNSRAFNPAAQVGDYTSRPFAETQNRKLLQSCSR